MNGENQFLALLSSNTVLYMVWLYINYTSDALGSSMPMLRFRLAISGGHQLCPGQ
jgi:hypothetical protein